MLLVFESANLTTPMKMYLIALLSFPGNTVRNIEAFHVLQTVFVKVCISVIGFPVLSGPGLVLQAVVLVRGGLPLLEKSCGFTGLMQVGDTFASSLLASRP